METVARWRDASNSLKYKWINITLGWLGEVFIKHHKTIEYTFVEGSESSIHCWNYTMLPKVKKLLSYVYEEINPLRRDLQKYGSAVFIFTYCVMGEVNSGWCYLDLWCDIGDGAYTYDNLKEALCETILLYFKCKSIYLLNIME